MWPIVPVQLLPKVLRLGSRRSIVLGINFVFNVSGTIPAGVSTVDSRVTPINDTSMEANQTVIVTLAPSARYTIGSPRSATVTIVSNE